MSFLVVSSLATAACNPRVKDSGLRDQRLPRFAGLACRGAQYGLGDCAMVRLGWKTKARTSKRSVITILELILVKTAIRKSDTDADNMTAGKMVILVTIANASDECDY